MTVSQLAYLEAVFGARDASGMSATFEMFVMAAMAMGCSPLLLSLGGSPLYPGWQKWIEPRA